MASPDAAIAGGGIIGMSLAWKLSQKGLRVMVFDAGRVGGEASWASAGMLAPGGEVKSRTQWSDFALESLRLYPAFIEELQQESGCGIDYQREGAVEVALEEGEAVALERRAAAQRSLGIPSEELDTAELARRVPLLGRAVVAARFYPEDALVAPRDVMAALRAACERRGVAIREHTRVLCCSRRARITTDGGTWDAGMAAICAGAWSGDIAIEGEPHAVTFPVKGHLLGYKLRPGSLGPILRQEQTYMLQRRTGFTVVGTSSERVGFNRAIDPAIVSDIARRAADLAPSLRAAGTPDVWNGFRPATDLLVPEIGRIADTPIWRAYGHYRNGILLAPATAIRVTRQMTEIVS